MAHWQRPPFRLGLHSSFQSIMNLSFRDAQIRDSWGASQDQDGLWVLNAYKDASRKATGPDSMLAIPPSKNTCSKDSLKTVNYLESLELVVWFHSYPKRISQRFLEPMVGSFPSWGTLQRDLCPSGVVPQSMRHPISLGFPTRVTWRTWDLPAVRVSDESWMLESLPASSEPPWDRSFSFTPL